MLLRLAEELQRQGVDNFVVSLSGREPLADAFEARGIPVYSLAMSPGVRGGAALRQLKGLIERLSPDVLQGWMYHANLMLTFVRPFLKHKAPVVWNIRRGTDDMRERKFLTRLVIRTSAWLSSRADRIVYCTQESREQHEAFGFARTRGIVIGNGFDVERFSYSPEARRILRERFGVTESDILIGNIGRDDSAKGRSYLIEAFAEVLKRAPSARLMLIGRGMSESNPDLRRLLVSSGVVSRVILVGEYSPISELYSAMDMLCSSSVTEGFPNVIGEAMSCEVPCAASDVGNVRALLDGVGIVVPARSASPLAEALVSMCGEGRDSWRELGARSRARIAHRYSLESVVSEYAALYRDLTSEGEVPPAPTRVPVMESSESGRNVGL